MKAKRRFDALIALAGLVCLAIPGSVWAQSMQCAAGYNTCNYTCAQNIVMYPGGGEGFITNTTPLRLGHCYPGTGFCAEGVNTCTGQIYNTPDCSGTFVTVSSNVTGCPNPV